MSLEVLRTVREARERLGEMRHQRRRVGLVPTMGALHAGHASLIEAARSHSDFVVVSIFVNPLQFGPNEDYLRYPRPLDRDLEVCAGMGANLVFAPEVEQVYAGEQLTLVEVGKLGDHLCGPYRPGHFRGVATVVAKLFNMTRPDSAFFGEKDYQQLCIIRRMVHDLNFGIEIVPVPIYREPDGLALSSRNVYLNPEEREIAPLLFRSLTAARQQIEQGESDPEAVRQAALGTLSSESRIRAEYLEVVDPVDVQPVRRIEREVRVAGAIWIGKTRLIDNVAAMPREL